MTAPDAQYVAFRHNPLKDKRLPGLNPEDTRSGIVHCDSSHKGRGILTPKQRMVPESMFVVAVSQDADGIAKLVDAIEGTGVIEYFDSPMGPRLETRRVPLRDLRRIELATQTRIFRLDPISSRWSIGRVDGGLVSGKALGKSEDHYHVRFPNHHEERVPISELFVRRNRPVEDPTEYLASMITDTPFFFDGRSRIVRHLANQRRLFGGLTGLASSAIELLEHQVSVVRRVLSDPIQRYLLADEVGLGKTIEAGVVIRQHLLDHPDRANVRVIVPDHLVPQWRKELRNDAATRPAWTHPRFLRTE